ncbi:MAG: alpha/beta hydrolase [Bacteroidota bacterium]
MKQDILLLHGSFHDKTSWDALIPELEQLNFRVHTLTLLGNEDGKKSAYSIRLNSYVQQLLSAIEQIGKPLILLGHSMSGALISLVGEERPDLIKHLIYLSAIVPRKKDRIYKMGKDLPVKDKSLAEEALKLTFQSLLKGRISIDREKAKEAFYGGQSPEEQEKLSKSIVEQPFMPFLGKISWTEGRLGTVSKSYIECKHDKAHPINQQRAFQAYMNFSLVKTLESNHCPFYLMPRELAVCIQEIDQALSQK